VSHDAPDIEQLTAASGSTTPETRGERTPAQRRERARLIALGIVGALIVVFAVVNLNDVKVHWVLATGQTPLIIVIVVAFLLGMLADRLVIRARRKRQQ
jgi:uncharacterized integral membrane protein